VVSIFAGEAKDLIDRSNRPQSLIITIYGAYSRSLGGWLSSSAIVSLCAELDVDEASVRSALSRFKRRGILISKSQNGVQGYALSAEARKTFELGDSRVLERREAPRDEGWVLVAFSIPEKNRALRYQLRSRLIRVGFAQVTGGLWIAPRQLTADVTALAKSLNIEKHMSIFSAHHLAFQPTPSAVAQWWDLDGISVMYKSFSTTARPVLKKWFTKKISKPDPHEAFIDYTKVLTNWRHVPYFDPGLPKEYLPKNWPGFVAMDSFFKVHDALAIPALNYFHSVAGKVEVKKKK
jgi:phenylacetic acid degradation operon negative regulatory protein